MCFLVGGLVACSTDSVKGNVVLTARVVNLYSNYDNVESIMFKYKTLFTDDEIVKLTKIDNEFRDIYNNIKKISLSTDTLQKILVDLTSFNAMYAGVRDNYIQAKMIINQHLSQFDIKDRAVLATFDSNAQYIDASMVTLQSRLATNSINEEDITILLNEIVTFVNSSIILLAK